MIEFSIPSSPGGPFSITSGPDGNVWFTEVNGNKIGQITPSGVISEFVASGSPGGITMGPDGALWFTEIGGNKIGRITTSGAVTDQFPILSANAVSHRITTGPDGALWFAEAGADKIGRITTTGVVTEFNTLAVGGTITAGSAPFDIVSGPDGALWFTEIHSNKIGRITTAGAITEFTVGNHPSMITAGPDGALWFSESDTEQSSNPNKIGRITTGGSFTEFSPPTDLSKPQGITVGSDGALWFTEAAGNNVGRLMTDGTFSELTIPTPGSVPFGIASGPDGNIWFVEFLGNKIGEITVNHPPVATAADLPASTKGQVISASSLFSASDVDNNALTYFFYDNTADAGSGHFTVNGTVEPANTTFALSAAQLAQTTFTAGLTVSDDLFVNVYDGFAFSGPKEFHVIVPPNHAPTATVIDQSSPSGQVISVSSLFLASDADNDALTYFFYDNTADAGSGHFTVNGTVEPANTTFSVSAAQLAQTTFTAGSTVSDDLFVNVYDGTAFSQPKEFHVNVPPNHAPVATAPDHGALSGQTISASSLFLANDADNNALTYFFYDNTADAGSGHFTVNGTVEPANTTFAVSAAQLAQTTFTAGSTASDDLFVNVYDGTSFSQPKEFHVLVVPPNQAPMATAPDFSAAKGQVVSASSLFLASDADNDALTYFFYDNTADAGSGHFTVNGTVEPANTTFAVSAAQLAQTTFTAGSTASDDLFVNIYDGTSFSQPKEFHVNVSPNHAPEATAPDHSAPSGQVINASSLFLANDADNDTLTYFFYDNTPGAGSGHFTVNGTVEPANTTFSVSAAQLAQTTFTAGSTVSDDLFVNVYDGIAFSQPKEFHLLLA